MYTDLIYQCGFHRTPINLCFGSCLLVLGSVRVQHAKAKKPKYPILSYVDMKLV